MLGWDPVERTVQWWGDNFYLNLRNLQSSPGKCRQGPERRGDHWSIGGLLKAEGWVLIFIFIRNPSGSFQPTTLCQLIISSNTGPGSHRILPPRHPVVGISPGYLALPALWENWILLLVWPKTEKRLMWWYAWLILHMEFYILKYHKSLDSLTERSTRNDPAQSEIRVLYITASLESQC